MVWAIGIVCAVGTAYLAKYHRLAALILMGGAGLVVCITFAWLSAPDLALTQVLVEIVTTVLILLGLRWLPKRLEEATPSTGAMAAWLRRSRDLIIAVAAGAGLSTIAYAMMMRPPPDGISQDSFWSEPKLKVVAPTSSTSSSSTFAASTRSAKSPCSA